MTDKRGAVPKFVLPKRTGPKATTAKQPYRQPAKTMRTPPKTMRTPPKPKEPENQQANDSVYLCQICSVEDNIEKVRCDKCVLWYHFTCAKLSRDVLQQDVWMCINCVEKPQASVQPSDPIDIELENPSGYSSVPPHKDKELEHPQSVGDKSRGSRKSNSTTSTVSRRAALALQKLEEERRLSELRDEEEATRQRQMNEEKRKRDKEYLSQRYAILEDDVMSNLSFDEHDHDDQNFESIHQWTSTVPNANNQLEKDDPPVDVQLSRPQQSSTIISPQIVLEGTTAENLTSGVVTTVEGGFTSKIPADVPTSKCQIELPDWLTNPKSQPHYDQHPYLWSYSCLDLDNTRRLESTMRDMTSQANDIAFTPPVQSNNTVVEQTVVDPPEQSSIVATNMVTATISSTLYAQPSQTNTQQQFPIAFDQTKADIATKASARSYGVSQDNSQSHQQADVVQSHVLNTNQQSSLPVDGMVSRQMVTQNTIASAVPSNYQSGVVNPQFSNGTPQYLNTNQPFDNTQTNNYCRQHPGNQTFNVNHQDGRPDGNRQSFNTGQLYNQPQVLGASHQQLASQPQVLGVHQQQVSSQPQVLGSSQQQLPSQPQVLGASHQQLSSQPQVLGASHQQLSSQPQVLGASQQQLYSQPRVLGANQLPSHSQPQVLGSSQQQKSNFNQSTNISQSYGHGQQYGTTQTFTIGTSQAFGNGQSNRYYQPFVHGQLSGNNQSSNTSQPYSQTQTLGIGQSIASGIQYVPINSMVGQPSIGNTIFIPISQPHNMTSVAVANNGMNQSYNQSGVMSQFITTGRLTAEQIASRHVVPKDLPIFNGDPRQWYAFISAYENANDTCGFSDSENLGRLQKCLKGDAELAVKSRLFHKDSVPGVIDTLRLMFGRPELIMETLLGDIQKVPAPKEDDLHGLIKFAMSVQNLSATIQHCGASEHLQNPMLLNSIVDKLPATHRMQWAFFKRQIGQAHIGHLGDWLYDIADAASRVVRVSSRPIRKQEPHIEPHKNNNKSKSDVTKSNPFINTQVEKPSVNNQSNGEIKRNCPACNTSKCYKLVNCKKFNDASRAERWTIVKKGGLCGRCFGNHKFYLCQSDQTCSIDGCKASHHKLLHNYESSSKTISKSSGVKSSEKSICNSQRSEFNQQTDKFRIVPVMLHYKNKTVCDYAYLDDGSNMSTMEDSLANELELIGTTKELCVDWAFGQTHSTENSRIVSVKISGYFDNAPRFNLTNVRTVKQLYLPTQTISTSWIDQYPHLKNVPIATYESVKPRILIGLRYSRLMVSLETIEGKEDEPIVCKTRLGWVVQGPTYESDKCSNGRQTFSMNMCVCQSGDNELHQLVKNYFSIEHLGIKIPENSLESIESKRAKQILDSTTVKIGDRYETGLLWKDDDVELPDSYNMALKRLICLETKMAKNPEIKSKLFTQMKEFVEKGYIRKLSTHEVENCKQRVWYLPTFPVFNPKKPEKVRLVWDGAAKVKNTSLNSNLLVGPDELVPLPELLRRFRERKVGITGDIAEMFHQIHIRESDQHAQRFLWREDSSLQPDIYIMLVMTFGSKCSPSSAQYVKNKNANEFQEQFPRAVESIVHNHYVDDMIDSADSIDEAETLVNDVKMIHRSGGFNIRNFASNYKELLVRIGEDMVPESKDLNVFNTMATERVLGMFWNTVNDCFTYSLKFTKVNENMLTGKHHPTKREVLKILMSVFDPLGLLANFLVHGKILLQEIWRSKVEWDERISQPTFEKWNQWIRALPSVEKLQIPRWYSTKLAPERSKSIQLHTFVDAGAEACCGVSYLRIEDEEGVDCCLVSAKTKVAPTKPMSIPRLELQAAVIGTRLAANVKISQRFTFDKEVYWTDSQTVMAWINSETRRYNQFVSFRIGEIIETTEANQWRWVPTKHNVADEATKSKNIPQLASNSRWYKAPAFLYETEQQWPGKKQNFTTEEELRPCFVMAAREIQSQQLIDLDRFSQWNRLVRTQAFVLRFVYNLKVAKRERRMGPFSQAELIRAESFLYQRAQRDQFMDEILIIKHNEKVPPAQQKVFEKSSELRTFSPYLDENNVLRQRGRIDAADSISYDTKRPIILPRRHRITKLLVDWFHRRYKHLNHQTALNEIRQKFIIPALRVVMKGVRNSCQKCKNSTVMPSIPEMSGLPPTRLATFTRPFTFTGVDYFGPYSVKVNRSVVPRYGVIFTCLTTRAIHLEVADSLNTSSCIDAVRRFSARKGKPRKFHSDNGTNFHGADNELKKEFEKLDKYKIEQEFTSSEQEWTFNPPSASHMGGVWERLIATVKSCLNQMLTTKTPTQEMLTTLMAEVENIVNSRPLTYISLDTVDDEALTPNHFLFGSSNALTPIADTTPRDLYRNDWRAIQEMTKHFWHRFVLEYLPDLTKRTKWLKQVNPIKVGDVVLVIDERNPRNTWPKGIVEEVTVPKDGHIRQVMVRFGKRTLRRPVSKLAILDVNPHNKEGEVQLNPMESLNGGKNVVQH